jgi:hypothetical protein
MDLGTLLKQDESRGFKDLMLTLAIADRLNSPWVGRDVTDMSTSMQDATCAGVDCGLVIAQNTLELDVADRTYWVNVELSGVRGVAMLLAELESKFGSPPAWPARVRMQQYRASAAGIEIGRLILHAKESTGSDPELEEAWRRAGLATRAAMERLERGEVRSYAKIIGSKIIPREPLAFGIDVDPENGEIRREGYRAVAKLSANMARIVRELAQNHGLMTKERMDAVCQKLGISSGKSLTKEISLANRMTNKNRLREIGLQIKKNKRGKGKHGGAYRLLELLHAAKVTK